MTALRAIVLERQQGRDAYRASTATSASLERIAQVSYDAGERGILELLDAYRTGAAARTRQALLDAAARQAEIELELTSGWGRSDDDSNAADRVDPRAGLERGMPPNGRTGAGPTSRSSDARCDELDGSDRALHGAPAARRGTNPPVCRAPHAPYRFPALDSGRPSIEMMPEAGGPAVVLPGSDALRPGAFRVEGKLPPAGRYRWALVVSAPGLSDRHDLGTTTVFADEPSAAADAGKRPEKDAAAIAYLKGAAMDESVRHGARPRRRVRTSIRVPATIEPVTGGEAMVSAPADGRFASDRFPSVGDRVSAGQELGRLEPRLASGGEDRASLVATVTEAQATLDGAKADLARARSGCWRSVPSRPAASKMRAGRCRRRGPRDRRPRPARSARRRAEGRRRERIGERVRAARANRRPGRRGLRRARCPRTGQGAPLFRVVRGDRVELQAQQVPPDAPLARGRRLWRSRFPAAPTRSS